MNNHIYIPYFYIIQDKRNLKYYAGCKYAKDANPCNFMIENGYTTSSNTIHKIIDNFGIDIFIIRKIRIFKNKTDVLDYETKFLKRVKARTNTRFYNSHENTLFTYDSDEFKSIMLKLYGVENASNSPEIQAKIKKTFLLKYGVESVTVFGSKQIREKIKQTNLERYGVENVFQTEEVKDKIKQTNLERYGVENSFASDAIKDKIKQTNLERYGVENYSKTDEYSIKYMKTSIEKYGVENPNQSDIIKAKIKSNCIAKYGVSSLNMLESVKKKKLDKTKELSSREVVQELRKYRDKFKIKYPQGWYRKATNTLLLILEEYKEVYGEL